MAGTDAGPRPGAVVVVAGPGEDSQRARERAGRAFRAANVEADVFTDGPLTLAFAAAPDRELHVSETVVCLVEGALYEVPSAAGRDDDSSPGAADLAHGYQRRGEALLPGLRGEFWALLWDRREGRGLVMADQLGSRSPYWAHDDTTLIVGSEIAELLASLSRQPGPDRVTLAHWLLSTGPKVGTTLYDGVQSIAAGHCLEASARACPTRRYWAPTYGEPLRLSRAEQALALRDRLERAISRRRAHSDGTGILLSGGLDSSTVAALASRQGKLRAYSAVFPDHPSMDESSLIKRTVSSLGIASTRIDVRSGSTIRGALDYIQAWKVPPTSPNLFFWAPLLRRAAADGVQVMLDGEGGDELFAFSPYLVADRLRAGRWHSALALSRRWPGDAQPPSRDLIWLRLRLAGAMALMPPIAHRLSRRIRGLGHYAPPWLPRELSRAWLEGETSSFAWKELSGPRWWAYLVDMVTRGAGPSVVYEQSRRRGALAGVVASHPLVDVDVIELVLRLDPELSFDQRFSRSMLREAMSGHLPDEVRLRRGKSNFDALFHQLLAGPELPALRALLNPAQAHVAAYVDMHMLDEDLLRIDPRSHREGLSRWAIRVWRLITAEIWLRSREDPSALGRLEDELGLAPLGPGYEFHPGG